MNCDSPDWWIPLRTTPTVGLLTSVMSWRSGHPADRESWGGENLGLFVRTLALLLQFLEARFHGQDLLPRKRQFFPQCSGFILLAGRSV